jgi:eukaryotic-like serine/threonine-protein kinase
VNGGIVWCPHCGGPHPLATKVCPVSAKTLERNVNRAQQLPENPLVGSVVGGKYFVHRLIGSGAMGEVFEAENRVLRRMVALKIVRGAIATPEAVSRLEREALLVSAVQHPNICDVYDTGVLNDGSPFLVLERLFGETLGQLLHRKRTLPASLVLDVFEQMLSGLQAAHGAQIIHRDLKPQNVFLVDRLGCNPLVKLLDFGLARDLSGLRARTITKPGTLLGTLKYMAPEQLRRAEIDPRADLFAVGVMLYEAFTGKHPFEAPTLADMQANILRCEPRSLSLARPDLPPATGRVVDRALAKDPAARWSTALEMQRALAQALRPGPRPGDTLSPSDEEPPPSSLL